MDMESEQYTWLQLIGLQVFAMLDRIKALIEFIGVITQHSARLLVNPKLFHTDLFFEKFYDFGPRSFPLLIVGSVLAGVLSTVFIGAQLVNYNAIYYLSDAMTVVLTRLLVPTIVTMVLLFRGVVLFTQHPVEHYHGYEAEDTVAHLAAFVMAAPMLYLWCLLICLITNFLVTPLFDISIYNHFWRMNDAVQLSDLIKGISKSMIYGIIIGLTTLRYQQNPYNNLGASIAGMIFAGIFWVVLFNTMIELLFTRAGL